MGSELRVVALVSSARRRGNCYDIAEVILAQLRKKGVETELIRTVDYEINPCNRCSYECFREGAACPIDDDVPWIWEKMKEADGIVFSVPSYFGLPPAVFKAIIERAQGILSWVTEEFRDLESVWSGKPVIAAVVANGGGETIVEYLGGLLSGADVGFEHFSYVRLGRPGFKGGLIELPEVVSRVEELAEEIYLKLTSSGRE